MGYSHGYNKLFAQVGAVASRTGRTVLVVVVVVVVTSLGESHSGTKEGDGWIGRRNSRAMVEEQRRGSWSSV